MPPTKPFPIKYNLSGQSPLSHWEITLFVSIKPPFSSFPAFTQPRKALFGGLLEATTWGPLSWNQWCALAFLELGFSIVESVLYRIIHTPGRVRAWNNHNTGPKQSKIRKHITLQSQCECLVITAPSYVQPAFPQRTQCPASAVHHLCRHLNPFCCCQLTQQRLEIPEVNRKWKRLTEHVLMTLTSS